MNKPRLVEVMGEECQRIVDGQGELNVPLIYKVQNCIGLMLVEADELRAWRAAQAEPEGKSL